jgi:predicted HAD superfamily phosphohydrolase YqeG
MNCVYINNIYAISLTLTQHFLVVVVVDVDDTLVTFKNAG